MLYERILVITKYNVLDFQGKKDCHLLLMSSHGNEKFMNKESLGEKLVDGYRVITGIPLNAFYVEPLKADGTGVKMFYVSRAESSGVPFYIYKRFGSYKVSSVVDKMMARIATYQC